MRIAVFPGSFDPVTVGHLDLIQRASVMFDKVVIGVLNNSAKKPFCTVEQKMEMLKLSTQDISNVEIESFDGLLVDFVEKKNAVAVIRGIRNSMDFEYELPLAQANHKLNANADTIFLATRPEHSYISSSAVRELIKYKADIKDMVPEPVYRFVMDEFAY
ncbi:MAG: pantetheine-phosphate adenylyltransferase [Lachnospiraceae bacterium]|nr:pantetheine-phosphate adenylyltransferase [Lachnospiraceae bacterium]MBQ2320776.1 pantetheine-phosphate adenylyltransferase [Lachnospiraceae bacterium]